eukprot:6385206-Prymnesium_polylepis.2
MGGAILASEAGRRRPSARAWYQLRAAAARSQHRVVALRCEKGPRVRRALRGLRCRSLLAARTSSSRGRIQITRAEKLAHRALRFSGPQCTEQQPLHCSARLSDALATFSPAVTCSCCDSPPG